LFWSTIFSCPILRKSLKAGAATAVGTKPFSVERDSVWKEQLLEPLFEHWLRNIEALRIAV
jgi:hypothetical protein